MSSLDDYHFNNMAQDFAHQAQTWVSEHNSIAKLRATIRPQKVNGMTIYKSSSPIRVGQISCFVGYAFLSQASFGTPRAPKGLAFRWENNNGSEVWIICLGEWATKTISSKHQKALFQHTGTYSTLIHEATHVIDLASRVSASYKHLGSMRFFPPRCAEPDYRGYYSSPEEFNAMFHEGLHAFSEGWANMKATMSTELTSTERMKKILNTFWGQDFLQYLSPDMKKHLIKRVYRLLQ